jgi:Reverse transcriptase (RNA-dependent DNA polymerase)
MDIKNIFLQGTLEEKIYMTLPPDHAKENCSNLICRFKKLIYGLKQSLRAWYDKLNSYLNSCNFLVSNAEHALFV